ncbi:MAG: hypothetical protein WCY84_02690 [Candidatus Cloacimonadaceae bacterium]
MKRSILILLLALILLIAGCGKKTTTPDFTAENWMQKGEYTLIINSAVQYMGVWDQMFLLVSISPVDEITINGTPYPMDYFLNEEMGEVYFFNYIYLNDYSEPRPLVAPGESCNYSFVMNGKTHQGNVLIPCEFEVNFPRFNYDANYKITWTSNENPDNYLVDCVFEDCYIYEETYKNIVQLAGSDRKYSIYRKVWQHLDKLRLEYWIALYAINYTKKEAGSLAVAALSDSYNNWKQAESFRDIQDWQLRFFRQIQSGKIHLQ